MIKGRQRLDSEKRGLRNHEFIEPGDKFHAHFEDPLMVTSFAENFDDKKRFWTFEAMQLPEPLASNVKRYYETPVPIQQCVIPHAYDGQDVLGLAPTGSGKTAAYLIPVITLLFEKDLLKMKSTPKKPLALVLLPTHESASQIASDFRKLGEGMIEPFNTMVTWDGTAYEDEKERLLTNGCHVLFSTPGCIIHFIEEGVICLSECLYLVLDEVDQMFDRGFKNQFCLWVRYIVEGGTMLLNTIRQTLMFSATFPFTVQKFATAFLHPNYVHVSVNECQLESKGGTKNRRASQKFRFAVNPNIAQEIIRSHSWKFERLQGILEQELKDALAQDGKWTKKIVVFVERRTQARAMLDKLKSINIDWAVELSRNLTDHRRKKSIAAFINSDYPVLVATSVASHGLDIKEVDLVINYELPKGYDCHGHPHMTPEQRILAYVQRIGRTGRVGHMGRAIAFYDHKSKDKEIGNELLKVLSDAKQEIPNWFLKLVKGSSSSEFIDFME